jgi:membrane protein DedA with SNARE-associated domain
MKKRKTKSKFDKWFLLSWKKFFGIVIAWFLAVFLHNAVYALGIYFGGENFWGPNGDEAFFFIIALIVIPIYFLISVVYTLIKKIKMAKW